jgi:hypothetical protein
MPGGALVSGRSPRADAILVAAEGALDGRDFLVDNFFQNRGALDCMFNTTYEKSTSERTAGRGGEAFGCDVLRPDRAHGRCIRTSETWRNCWARQRK